MDTTVGDMVEREPVVFFYPYPYYMVISGYFAYNTNSLKNDNFKHIITKNLDTLLNQTKHIIQINSACITEFKPVQLQWRLGKPRSGFPELSQDTGIMFRDLCSGGACRLGSKGTREIHKDQ